MHNRPAENESIFFAEPGPVIGPVAGEFQPPLETGCPGASAHFIYGFVFIFVLNPHGPWGRHNE
jgi:hypothetical protein